MPLNEKSQRLLDIIETKEDSVSVHVRRGDYLKAKNYAWLCGVDYYRRAIDYVVKRVEKPCFYVFSDDLEWCKEHIVPMMENAEVTLVDWNKGNDSPIDMLLMSRCHHNIIANSSFSWWATYLNRNKGKIVCPPETWTNTKINCTIQMEDWTYL